ncbi:MAG: hypothetical protein ABFD24_07925 [Anaerolineaceae bacterium]
MTNQVNENALILVAVLPSVRDYEIARLLGWYRIPLRMAPKIVAVDMLAFYQPGTFGVDHRWQIEHVAEVKGVELTTRAELLREEADHPRAKEEYYKLSIGPLQKLAAPLPAERWKRITFFYTLGELFNAADDIKDLVVRNEDRAILWNTLRERQSVPSIYGTPGALPQDMDASLLSFFLGGAGLDEEPSQLEEI